MRRKFSHGVRVFVYHPNFIDRAKISVPPFIANKIEWYDNEETAKEVVIKCNATLVRLARVDAMYRFGVFRGKLITFDL